MLTLLAPPRRAAPAEGPAALGPTTRSPAWISGLVVVLSACGAAGPPPETRPVAARPSNAAETSEQTPKEAPAEKALHEGLPTACADSVAGGLCTPPLSFVKRLCKAYSPDAALVLFAHGTPWTRGYLNRNVEAWNASGGASSNERLEFDEEVILLYHRAANAGGIQVSGSGGGYDVLRWDGTCASLASDEITLKLPPKAKHAKIAWKSLDNTTREALLADEKIGNADSERRKECKGATMGEVSLKCVKADARLSVVIIEYIRKGGTIPPPKLP